MKNIAIPIISILLFASPLFAEPTRNLTITVREGSESKDTVYKVTKFTSSDPSFPIWFEWKPCILLVAIETDDATKSKIIRITVSDPSNPSFPTVLNSSFPYSAERFPVYTSDAWTLSAQLTEDKQ